MTAQPIRHDEQIVWSSYCANTFCDLWGLTSESFSAARTFCPSCDSQKNCVRLTPTSRTVPRPVQVCRWCGVAAADPDFGRSCEPCFEARSRRSEGWYEDDTPSFAGESDESYARRVYENGAL